MGKFICQFPGCSHSSDDRHTMCEHHILPLSMGGVDLPFNVMLVCPNHHGRIYVPGMMAGIHSIRTTTSIVVNGWRMSTSGRMLEWEDPAGKVDFHIPPV